MNANLVKFDFLTSRLNFVEVSTDQLMNIDLSHYLSVFESHVYGVFLQYNRIKEDLNFSEPENLRKIPSPQAGLDIYYYTLTWDKLKKIYEKIKALINQLLQKSSSIPKHFGTDFRLWKRRTDHLFTEFNNEIRNEYEHPSMEPYSDRNIIIWGSILIDRAGNIKAHAGKDWFVTIKKDHVEKIQQLRTDLFDIFIKNFTEKPLTQQLMETKKYIEANIDSLSMKLGEYRKNENWDDFNKLLHQLTMCDLYFSTEGIPLSDEIKHKIYSVIFPSESFEQQ